MLGLFLVLGTFGIKLGIDYFNRHQASDNGWICFQSVNGIGGCYRERLECEGQHDRVERAAEKPTACSWQERAACMSWHDILGDQVHEHCSLTVLECEKWRYRMQQDIERDHVTACEAK